MSVLTAAAYFLVLSLKGYGSILSTLISLIKEICGYIIRIGGLLVLAEISENVYAIRTGDKSSDK